MRVINIKLTIYYDTNSQATFKSSNFIKGNEFPTILSFDPTVESKQVEFGFGRSLWKMYDVSTCCTYLRLATPIWIAL